MALNEGRYAEDFILSEQPGTLSREYDGFRLAFRI